LFDSISKKWKKILGKNVKIIRPLPSLLIKWYKSILKIS
jgi:hypothetical protein